MPIKVYYICARPYDFTNDNGKRVSGCNIYCYEPNGNTIIKVKLTSKSEPRHEFGEMIEVRANVSGNSVKFTI